MEDDGAKLQGDLLQVGLTSKVIWLFVIDMCHFIIQEEPHFAFSLRPTIGLIGDNNQETQVV